MHALIVEDEVIAADSLRRLLVEFAPELRVEEQLPSIAAALRRLSQPPLPDLIFMDVQLSDGQCFEIFDALPLTVPIIFTTAYDEFALKAFEVFGIDYLLKPIKPSRLAPALAKWRRLTGHGITPAPPTMALAQHYFRATQQYRTRFLVQQGEALLSIPTSEVAYFHKALVVRLVTHTGRAYPLSQSLDELEHVLDPTQFFRLNRQVLARAEAIVQAHRLFKGKLEVTLAPPLSEPVVVSQERAGTLREWLDR